MRPSRISPNAVVIKNCDVGTDANACNNSGVGSEIICGAINMNNGQRQTLAPRQRRRNLRNM